MDILVVAENAFYFLALINPTSKVLLLCSANPSYDWDEIRWISLKSTIVAFFILFVLTGIGKFILGEIFRVDIYSLRVAGGVVLFIIGLNAVRQGRFYEKNITAQHDVDISVVPVAAPLIAGPGTITAAIAFSSEHGMQMTTMAIFIALWINYAIMIGSNWIGKFLEDIYATGPLIRITGLIVSAVAVQMILTGLAEWLGVLLSPL